MIALHTPIEEYLRACEARGANADGDCPAFAWARAEFAPDTPLGEALKVLALSPVGMESAMFAFEHMLDVLDGEVRLRFVRILAENPSPVIHALNWRRLVAACEPTILEDWLLRSSWHSSWVGREMLPNWEESP
jgi:hypothetical protein